MYDFLSPEWIEAVEALRDDYSDQVPELPVAIAINLEVDDAPESVIESSFTVDTSSGSMVIEPGTFEEPDVAVSASYDLVRQLIIDGDGTSFMQAFLEGKILLQGDMARLMILQATIAQNADHDSTVEFAEKIRDLTA